jgi:hypothetical protein
MNTKTIMNTNWSDFYDDIKDSTWPKCKTTFEFKFLPEHIQQEILHQHNGSQYFLLSDKDIEIFPNGEGWFSGKVKKFFVAGDFAVLFSDEIDGNGRSLSRIFPLLIEKLYPDCQFHHGLEWCAGAGFIGFRLISDGIIDSLTLMDIYEPALQSCQATWAHRPDRLKHKSITTVQGSTVDCFNKQMFDLIVANPPNFDFGNHQSMTSTLFRITQDPGWSTHNDFFMNIKNNLTPNGKILMMKHVNGSQPSDHIKSIIEGGLKINNIINVKYYPDFYFLEITHS